MAQQTSISRTDFDKRKTALINYFKDGDPKDFFNSLSNERRAKLYAVAESAAACFPEAVAKATPQQIFKCFLRAANLGLLPNTHDGVIVMTREKNKAGQYVETPQFWVTTNGARRKVMAHPDVEYFDVQIVYDKDDLRLNFLSGQPPELLVGDVWERGAIRGVVGVVKLKSGAYLQSVMSKQQVFDKFLPGWAKKPLTNKDGSVQKDKKGNTLYPWHYSKSVHEGDFMVNAMTKAIFRKLPIVDDTKPAAEILSNEEINAGGSAADVVAQVKTGEPPIAGYVGASDDAGETGEGAGQGGGEEANYATGDDGDGDGGMPE